MVEALIAGNHEQCFKLLGEQRRQGEEEIKLFGLVLWQFRTLLSVSDLLEREGNLASDAIASRLKIHPFVAKKNMALTKRFSLARLEALYAELLEIDTKTKSGQADPGLLMDLFVARI
jgi:DNA polymerase-3 subunit delta